MGVKSPEEVLKLVSADLRFRGLTHEEAAKRLGFGSKQTLSNLLSSKKYLSPFQAQKFKNEFDYNLDFLTKGEGELYSFHGTHWDTETGKTAQKHGVQTFTVIDDTPEGTMDMVLTWFLSLFQFQHNDEGLSLWNEIFKYINAKEAAKLRVKKKGLSSKDEFYEFELEDALTNIQCSIIEKIDKILSSIHGQYGISQ